MISIPLLFVSTFISACIMPLRGDLDYHKHTYLRNTQTQHICIHILGEGRSIRSETHSHGVTNELIESDRCWHNICISVQNIHCVISILFITPLNTKQHILSPIDIQTNWYSNGGEFIFAPTVYKLRVPFLNSFHLYFIG